MVHRNIDLSIWLEMIKKIPAWEVTAGMVFVGAAVLFVVLSVLAQIFHQSLFHAFETIKLKKKDIDKALLDTAYIEITIPRDSQATAFQIQQNILKAFHSMYRDPIAGPHTFFDTFYYFQKMIRMWKVYRSRQVFFTMQIFAQYPSISFRLNIPKPYFERIEKAIFNAYPNAEITMVDKAAIVQELSKFQKNYLSYGESRIEGKFFHRVKTFKDVPSDPVDSIIATMEGLGRGRYMVYTVFVSPASHFFNQIIHFLLEEEERWQGVQHQPKDQREAFAQRREPVSSLASSLSLAMVEKMKASLFQVIVSYWTVSTTPEDAEAKLANIQAVLTQINQKNMNTLKHKRLFTKQIEELEQTGALQPIINMRPVLRRNKFRYWRFTLYENYGQLIADSELYSFWHLPNTTSQTVSSINMTKFKKLPASQQMREYSEDFFVRLGSSNFRMQEETLVGIPTWDDMKKHVYILGGTGAGKSETLKSILCSLLQKEGDEKTACLIVDPKNDFATDLLTMIPEHRREDVVYFNPSRQKDKPLSFPFFSHCSGEQADDERIEFLISTMKRFVQVDSAYSWGPELENILRQLFATAYLLPEQSLSGLDMLLHEPIQIKNILKYLPHRLQHFWMHSILKRTNNDLAKYLATTNNKIGKFLDYPELLNIADRFETKITIEEMIATGKIFIANLGSSSEQMKKYYSVYLTAHIAEAVFRQAKIPSEDRKPAVFVVDEFQRVASDMFETLFSQARAVNIAMVISNQCMGQLDERIQKSIESNIATKIFMRTQSVDDAEIAEKILGEKVTIEDVINLPTGTAYMKTLVHGVPQEAMSVNIQKARHPTDIAKDTEAFFIEQSMERYGTPVDVINQKRAIINTTYYSADREQIFFEHMGRHNTFQELPDTEAVILLPPVSQFVADKQGMGDRVQKTIFDS